MTEDAQGQVVTFYSYKGGTGRTMALANVAWILAANGLRVLVVDWDLESPGLARFFHPFLDDAALASTGGVTDLILEFEQATTLRTGRPEDWVRQHARVSKYALSLDWDFGNGGTLDFLGAGHAPTDYSRPIASLPWDDFYEKLGGGKFFDELRADMKRTYDYTLIDSRTGLSDISSICTLHLPDILVDCFTLSDQGIDGAARIAHKIRTQRSPKRDIRILPVPTRIDLAEKEKAERGTAHAKLRFKGLPAGLSERERDDYWAQVQIPYVAFYNYEEVLATFGDPPGLPRSLLAAYEQLTRHITQGRVTQLPPCPRRCANAPRPASSGARRSSRTRSSCATRRWTTCGRSGSATSSRRPASGSTTTRTRLRRPRPPVRAGRARWSWCPTPTWTTSGPGRRSRASPRWSCSW